MKANKTISINGLTFHIEEKAYEVFNMHMEVLRRHYMMQENGFEKMLDLERDIAGLFKAILLAKGRETIEQRDVEAAMANISVDIKAENSDRPPLNSRLFRDEQNGVLGGVCAGLAAYLNIHVIWVRMAWLFATIVMGLSIFAYIGCWMIIPKPRTLADEMRMRGKSSFSSVIIRIIILTLGALCLLMTFLLLGCAILVFPLFVSFNLPFSAAIGMGLLLALTLPFFLLLFCLIRGLFRNQEISRKSILLVIIILGLIALIGCMVFLNSKGYENVEEETYYKQTKSFSYKSNFIHPLQ